MRWITLKAHARRRIRQVRQGGKTTSSALDITSARDASKDRSPSREGFSRRTIYPLRDGSIIVPFRSHSDPV